MLRKEAFIKQSFNNDGGSLPKVEPDRIQVLDLERNNSTGDLHLENIVSW